MKHILFLLFPLCLLAQVQNIPNTTFPAVRSLMNSNFAWLAANKEPAIAAGTSGQVWMGNKSWAALDTSLVGENGNLYFTQARGRAAVSASSPLAYDSATGIFSCPTCGSGSSKRALNGPGIAAKCQQGFAFGAFSGPSIPLAVCEADGVQAYLDFAAATLQTIYDRFDLAADWTGTVNLVLVAYSSSTNAPTIAVSLACVGTGPTTPITWGTAQTISMTPAGSSGWTAVTTALAPTGCTAGNTLYWQLAITAADADLKVLSVRFTE